MYKGKRYHKHTVLVVISNIDGEREVKFPDVIAESPARAIDAVRDEVMTLLAKQPERMYPLNFYSWGPKGGETYRFSGWTSLVGECIWRNVRPLFRQLDLALP